MNYLILFYFILRENALYFSSMTTIHGTHQDPIGDILRHLVFNLVMNDLEDGVNDEVTNVGVDT